MTKEECKERWQWIIKAVFQAEYNIPDATEKLKKREITPDEYVGLIADEILDHLTLEGFWEDKEV